MTLAHVPAVHALISDPSLAREFEVLLPPGELEDEWKDPYFLPGLARLALLDGEPAGVSMGYVIPREDGGFAFLRIGVIGSRRRRGIGSALLRSGLEALERTEPGRAVQEISISAWLPNDGATGFAVSHGFRHARFFWRMDRERGTAVPPPPWPVGIEVREVDGSDRMLADWNQSYNRAFAAHFHFVPSTVAGLRQRMETEEFRSGAILLAYLGSACVGFCRDAFHGRRGEVALVGVVPEARGLGLGRALLRWGVDWIQARDTDTVELLVDGENENALALYRSEGFVVTETREVWSRPPQL